jgi:hypothetical protein
MEVWVNIRVHIDEVGGTVIVIIIVIHVVRGIPGMWMADSVVAMGADGCGSISA